MEQKSYSSSRNRMEDGHVFQRNRHNLLETKEAFQGTRCGNADGEHSVSQIDTVPEVKSHGHMLVSMHTFSCALSA